MEWFQWLQVPIHAVIAALGGLGLVSVINGLSTGVSFWSITQSLWRWLRGRRASNNTPLAPSAQQIQNEQLNVFNGQQATGTHGTAIGTMSHTQFIQGGVKNTINNYWVREQRKKQVRSRAKAQSPAKKVERSRRNRKGVKVVATAEAEPRPPIKIVPVLTPQEAKSQTHSESDEIIASPVSTADGDTDYGIAKPFNDTIGGAGKSASIEPKLIDYDSPAIETQHDLANARSVPTNGAGMKLEEDMSTGDGVDSDIVLVEPTILPDECNARNADAVRDAVFPTLDEEVDAKEANIDRDIGDIADRWSAEIIGTTLRRLRQARGLLPTDLSYDSGWTIAFEVNLWHTYQSERQRYFNGIRTYLQALGMTPAELRECLQRHDRQE